MGFEVFVRPAVVPNIRPAPPRAMLPPDAADKGIFTISGSGGGIIDLPFSHSWSATFSQPETQRTFERVRIASTSDGGGGGGTGTRSADARSSSTVDWSTYFEAEIATQIEFADNTRMDFDPPAAAANMQLMGRETRKAK